MRNLLFYEDPDYGLVLNATVRQPNVITNVHDHGDVWTLYGLIEGDETMLRYGRTDDGAKDKGPAALKFLGKKAIGAGDVDIVPPGGIHQEHAGPTRSISFIIRAKRPGTFQQRHYDAETGAASVNYGLQQMPMGL